ncbi:hypothetical protein SKAU_G00225310 [Synaphobranchus kaupii]|uniref:DH domain-containing protein n=1 Tax=Synaphobranchus kaupii TaxID=118154 RepID=A0A9Q1IVX5_SYNKA|nr:hypothetical protein SKAU_G00225310 [Synaphobranchus kaupii]
MDPGNPSPSSKPANLNTRGSDAAQIEEVVPNTQALVQWDPGRDAEVETAWASGKEIESAVDGVIPTALIQTNHKVAADKQRFNTVGYQKKQKFSVVPEFATVSKAASGNVKPRGALRQGLFNQGPSEKAATPELAALKQTLESFHLPALPDWKRGGEGGGGGGTDVTLEENWTQIVHSHLTMGKAQKHQQEALWELIHTELNYIKKLTIVNDLVIAALGDLRKNGFLSEVTPEHLFSNLPSILQAHYLFWQEVVLPMVQEVRETGRPFDPVKLEGGCMQFSERFAPYRQYCWEEERIVDFTRKQASNPQFQTYVEWVESCPLVGRMRLGDMQAKPHQRITKYPLLLKEILKSTQDPVTQYSVRRMLANVNSFLDNINEYMTFKDDELSLSQSAQRVDGYEAVETIGEEIDKHIREFCCFDLTSPIRGLGPGDIRKLLLEETLKIRDKKDNKLEAVALLFSDVLLVTKVQRKSEKLKVVRPPLALERTRCAALKDSCSFLLVEMSELGCAVNVYTVITPSPDSCSSWVSNILKAQESLATRREREMSHRLGEFRQVGVQIEKQALAPSEAERVSEERYEHVNQPEVETAISSGHKPKKEASKKPSANGTLQLPEAEKTLPSQLKNSKLAGRYIPISRSARGNFAMGPSKGQNRQSWKNGVEKEVSGSAQIEFGIKERRVTWNRTKPYFPNPTKHGITPTNSIKSQSNSSHSTLLGKGWNPEMMSLASSQGEKFNMDTLALESTSQENPLQGKFTRRYSKDQLWDQSSRRDSSISQSEDDFLMESGKFSRNLYSPCLRRRRPVDVQHNRSAQVLRKGSLDSGDAVFVPNANSSSNSDSDCNQSLRRTAHQPTHKPDSLSHLRPDLRSRRVNHNALWNGAAQRGSPEPLTIFEPELPSGMPEQNSQKRPKYKAQRSVSIPDMINQAGTSEVSQSFQPERCAQRHTSSLESVLARARERGKDREGEEENAGRTWRRYLSMSNSPALSPKEPGVGLYKDHTPTGAQEGGAGKEREEESDEERKYSSSFPFPDGASVDWSGWCVDDNEVMVFLVPDDSGGRVVAGGSRMLTLSDLQRISRQEDGECSEV